MDCRCLWKSSTSSHLVTGASRADSRVSTSWFLPGDIALDQDSVQGRLHVLRFQDQAFTPFGSIQQDKPSYFACDYQTKMSSLTGRRRSRFHHKSPNLITIWRCRTKSRMIKFRHWDLLKFLFMTSFQMISLWNAYINLIRDLESSSRVLSDCRCHVRTQSVKVSLLRAGRKGSDGVCELMWSLS